MKTTSILGKVNGARNLELVRTAVFNCWGVKVYGISIDSRDTVFTYQIQTDERLVGTAGKQLPVWMAGFLVALKAVS
jgi:hypothetical protein